jgi:hypothetical protein
LRFEDIAYGGFERGGFWGGLGDLRQGCLEKRQVGKPGLFLDRALLVRRGDGGLGNP